LVLGCACFVKFGSGSARRVGLRQAPACAPVCKAAMLDIRARQLPQALQGRRPGSALHFIPGAALSGTCCRSEPGTAGGPARTAPINMTPRGCILRPAWAERIRRRDWHAGRQGKKPGCCGTASGASITNCKATFLAPLLTASFHGAHEAHIWLTDALRAVPSNGFIRSEPADHPHARR